MARYRMMYGKKDAAKYISHLDLIRAFERAARRAGLPMAFTQGFNPHPKLTFAAPLAVGIAGEAEFADMELNGDIPAAVVAGSLAAALPEGLQVIEVRQVAQSAPALMAVVDHAAYTARAVLYDPPQKEKLKSIIDSFLDKPQIIIQRRNKKGETRECDIKPGIFALSAQMNDDIIELKTVLKTGSSGNIRIEELITALMEHSGLETKGNFILSRKSLSTAGGDAEGTLW
ncbi:MAG: DUF2344 domain-containing protein [Peptococcaceae bacterium]|nr:DUF2344 domain-containing protein [Candidatus Syntrophopropionicum ammoniitolerans]